MSSDPSPDTKVRITKTTDEVIYYPLRRSTRIEDGDWERWMQAIANIPKRENRFLDIALFLFGVAIPSLLSAIATLPQVAQLPSWISTIYFVVFCVTLGIGTVCFVFSRKIEKIISNAVDVVLQDMKKVHERAVRSEETTTQDTDISAQKGSSASVLVQQAAATTTHPTNAPDDGTTANHHPEPIVQERIFIHSAQYGAGAVKIDRTTFVCSQVPETGELRIQVLPVTLGVDDPLPGVDKQLEIEFSYGPTGKKHTKIIRDHNPMVIPVLGSPE